MTDKELVDFDLDIFNAMKSLPEESGQMFIRSTAEGSEVSTCTLVVGNYKYAVDALAKSMMEKDEVKRIVYEACIAVQRLEAEQQH